MSMVEIEKTLETLSIEEQRDVLVYLLQKFEDMLDVQLAEQAKKEGDYVDYMEFRKDLFPNENAQD